MKVFLDTNIWLRFFIDDKTTLHDISHELINSIEAGTHEPYTSAIVCLEVQYVLKTFYKQPIQKVHKYIEAVLSTRNMTLIDKTDFKRAWDLHRKTGNKLSDCLILTQIPSTVALCTFDEHLVKQTQVKTVKPEELVKEES